MILKGARLTGKNGDAVVYKSSSEQVTRMRWLCVRERVLLLQAASMQGSGGEAGFNRGELEGKHRVRGRSGRRSESAA